MLTIILWIIGSIILFNEKNDISIIVITAGIIITGLYGQISKYRNGNSGN